MSKLKAVFFDVDGTLLDTTEFIYQAFEHSLEQHGHEILERDDMKKMMGYSLEDCYRNFISEDTVEHLVETHRSFQMENYELSEPYPHTHKTLEALHKKGFQIAAITSRSRYSAEETLEAAEIIPYINYFIGFEDVVNPKPDPEPIQKALNFFSLQPQEALMVGDSDVDVFAGKAAETGTVGVTYGFHGEAIIDTEPDYVIDDIQEILEIVE